MYIYNIRYLFSSMYIIYIYIYIYIMYVCMYVCMRDVSKIFFFVFACVSWVIGIWCLTEAVKQSSTEVRWLPLSV